MPIMKNDVKFEIEIYGLLRDCCFQQAKFCAEDLFKETPKQFSPPKIYGMLEFDWVHFVNDQKKKFRGEMWAFKGPVMSFVNGQFIDDIVAWAEHHSLKSEHRPMSLYEAIAQEEYNNYFINSKNKFVRMAIAVDSERKGELLIQLFDDKCPETCENFRSLCSGERGNDLHYLDTVIHRIVPDGWIQGGDIIDGSGSEGTSVFGTTYFPDESFQVKHTERGIVGMANIGSHTNSSQFYITLQATKWMDCKYVAFGRVIEGSKLLEIIERLPTKNDRPLAEVRIADCGEVTAHPPHETPFHPDERGRPRFAENIVRDAAERRKMEVKLMRAKLEEERDEEARLENEEEVRKRKKQADECKDENKDDDDDGDSV